MASNYKDAEKEELQQAESKGLRQTVGSTLTQLQNAKLPTIKFGWGSQNKKPETPDKKPIEGSSNKAGGYFNVLKYVGKPSDNLDKQEVAQILNSAMKEVESVYTTLNMTQVEPAGEDPLLKTIRNHLKQAVESGNAIQNTLKSPPDGAPHTADINMDDLKSHLKQTIESLKAVQAIVLEHVVKKETGSSSSSQAASKEGITQIGDQMPTHLEQQSTSFFATVVKKGGQILNKAGDYAEQVGSAANTRIKTLIEEGKPIQGNATNNAV